MHHTSVTIIHLLDGAVGCWLLKCRASTYTPLLTLMYVTWFLSLTIVYLVINVLGC
jgi:hypothetical protein